ncbi:MAG: hypothetical protein GY934_07045, partial [Gammaproteobacteria bacterium]|nr:hypothetical protein [Gammaproteobacteria bacterium]
GLVACGGSDDPETFTVTFSDATVVEGDTGTTELIFSATISPATTEAASIAYTTVDVTTTAGTDYVTASGTGTLDIPAGSASASIILEVNGDDTVESDETLTLNLSDATGVTLTTASLTGTITTDDHADPKGYYTGTASVKADDDLTDRALTDLEGMISGDRFMILSNTEAVLYDGTITQISGSNFTATVDIYIFGVMQASIPASGSIITESTITGTLEGEGVGNGTFTLTYDLNNADSDLARVTGDWQGPLNGTLVDAGNLIISPAGVITRDLPHIFYSSDFVLGYCDYAPGSTVEAIPDVNVYALTLNLVGCNNPEVDGEHTGFITTQASDDLAIII